MANLMTNAPKRTPEQLERDQEISKRFAELSERTRLLEERVKQAYQKVQVIDETNLKKVKDLKDRITSIDEQFTSMRKELDELKEVVRRIAKDMGQTAKLSDVRVLEKYINMVDITRLITKEDVYQIIEDIEAEKKKKKG
jgi:methyl-accepting chemotaxis protein